MAAESSLGALRGPVWVTGSSGLIGRALVAELLRQDIEVAALGRSFPPEALGCDRFRPVRGDLATGEGLDRLAGAPPEAVFHLASHRPQKAEGGEDEAEHWAVTVTGSARLLEQAAAAGARRLIFLSSIRAETGDSLYGRAKAAAENLLLAPRDQDPQVTVLRLPAVYGGGRDNVQRLLQLAKAGRLPPLPQIGNRRAMIHRDDVVQALLLAAATPNCTGGPYGLSDGEAYSAERLDRAIRQALGRPPRRPWPLWVWRLAAAAGDAGQLVLRRPLPMNRAVLEKICGDLWLDDRPFRELTGFQARYTLEQALADGPGLLP